jgi:serine/threonine-protein kinase
MSDSNIFDANLRAALEPAYTLERELVGGGMSRVFLATERALNRQVVIKVLPPDLAAGVNRERFRREIQLAAQLQHPHIVPLYSAGEHGEMLFYTMPFIEGESLKHAIHERQGKSGFSPREVVSVLHDVADALAYAHARGVVHRDIKPGNVLRSGRHAVVTDFGVAKAISASMPSVGATTSGMAIGTPAYMAPEQLAGDPAADHRMDIYAVGLLGYELLAGEAPFNETSPQATMAAQLTRSPEPLSNSREDVPPQLSALIMKCLEKNPSARPQTAAALLAELDALAFYSGDYFPSAKPRRKRAVIGGVLLAIVATGLVIKAGRNPLPLKVESAAVPVAVKPAALTRADSLAIAKAVEARIAERTAAAPAAQSRRDSAMLAKLGDSLRSEMMKAVFDSLAKTQAHAPPPGTMPSGAPGVPTPPPAPGGDRGARMLVQSPAAIDSMVRALTARGGLDRGQMFQGRGGNGGQPFGGQPSREMNNERMANLGPPRRILVTTPAAIADRKDVAAASAAIADSLRRYLASTHRYVIVSPRDEVHSEALTSAHAVDSVTKVVNADMVASIIAATRRDSSVSWTVLLRDATAGEWAGGRSVSARAAKDSLLAPEDSLVSRSARYLELLDHSPRRGAVDPIQRAFEQRAANMGPPRRVVVWDHPPDNVPGVRDGGSAVMDVLRKALATSTRYVPVSRDSTLAVLDKSRERNAVLAALHADMMVSIRGRPVHGDSVSYALTVWDLGAVPQLASRSVGGPASPLSAPLLHADTLVSRVIQELQQIDRSPRQTAGAAPTPGRP